MLKLNGEIVELNHFPDGTLRMDVDVFKYSDYRDLYRINWKFENNEELVGLIYLVKHIRRFMENTPIILYMDYIPNARMDRVKNNNDVFTLKYFSEIINSLNFEEVIVCDPHSSVSEALIDHLFISDIEPIVSDVIKEINENNVVVYFPDNGAAKKYEGLFKGCKTVYGIKHRDWNTGKIQGLEVVTNGIDLKDKIILMFDDIVSYGGSLYYSALKLKELGVGKIYAYATHTENSILDKEKGTLIKLLEDGTVERLFTTSSLFTGEHEKITVL